MLEDGQIARRIGGLIETRAGGLRVHWELGPVVLADGHQAKLAFACIVRAVPNENDRKMLAESLLAERPILIVPHVRDYFQATLFPAAMQCLAKMDIDRARSETGKAETITGLMAAGQKLAFGCGLELLPPATLEIDSPTLRQQMLEEAQRQALQRQTQARVEHLQSATELFRQFESLRQASPSLSPGQILARIAPTDQAELLRSLLQASAQKQTAASVIWLAVADALVKITPPAEGSDLKTQLVPVLDTLGPLRSVSLAAAGTLLAGARSGVWVIDVNAPDKLIALPDAQTTSAMGFNRAVGDGAAEERTVIATHSEAGVVAWKIAQPNSVAWAIRGVSAKHLTRLPSGNLLAAVKSQLLCIMPDGINHYLPGDADAEIIAILPLPDSLLIVRANGRLERISSDDFASLGAIDYPEPLAAAALLPWLGSTRVLLAPAAGPPACIGLDDELTTQYRSVYQQLILPAASSQFVAAVTADRQRLVLWPTWDGRQPMVQINVAALARHRITDIAL